MDPFVLGAFFQDFEVLDVSKSPIPLLFRCLFEDSERHKSGERGHYRVVGKVKVLGDGFDRDDGMGLQVTEDILGIVPFYSRLVAFDKGVQGKNGRKA